MSWFSKKPVEREPSVMFDIDKVKALESLTPIQILELVCASQQLEAHEAVLMDCNVHNYQSKYPAIAPFLRLN